MEAEIGDAANQAVCQLDLVAAVTSEAGRRLCTGVSGQTQDVGTLTLGMNWRELGVSVCQQSTDTLQEEPVNGLLISTRGLVSNNTMRLSWRIRLGDQTPSNDLGELLQSSRP